MKYSKQIKPISYFKSNAAKIIKEINENRETMIITQNGEATAVVQGIREYEKLQDKLALLQIIAHGEEEFRKGKYKDVKSAFKEFDEYRKKIKNDKA